MTPVQAQQAGYNAGFAGKPATPPSDLQGQLRNYWVAGHKAGVEDRPAKHYKNGADRARQEIANKCSAAGVQVENAVMEWVIMDKGSRDFVDGPFPSKSAAEREIRDADEPYKYVAVQVEKGSY